MSGAKNIVQQVGSSFLSVINGNVFTREAVIRLMPFLLFLALLALLYISVGFITEGNVREINKLNVEIKELRSEYITTKSELMHHSKQSELVDLIIARDLGLEESFEPPKKIVVKR